MLKYRFLSSILALFCGVTMFAGINLCFYYDGYWGDWSSPGILEVNGSYNGFVIYDKLVSHHPSDYFFKFNIDNRTPPTKKEIKKSFKSKTWWEYTGTVEYYVCDVYPTFTECVKHLRRPLCINDLDSEDYKSKLSVMRASYLSKGKSFTPFGYKKVRSRARIRIAPYSTNLCKPKVYNIWFDDVAIGIEFDYCGFRDSW